jgi:phage terminase small subunit
MPKTKKVKPTEKQKRFVREKLKGKSNRRAALDAGYSPNTAKNPHQDILAKPGTQNAIEKLRSEFKKLGFDEKLVAKRLYDSMFAEKLNNKGDAYTDWGAVHKAVDKWGAFNDLSTSKTVSDVKLTGIKEVLGEVVKSKDEDKSETE